MINDYYKSILHYTIVGNGIPVILLHGLGCDHRLMTGCMEPIFHKCDGYKRIYIDLPGMGKSKAPLELGSSDGILEILLSFIADIVKESFLLVGESYGGYLARGILSKLSNQINGMALICPVVFPEQSKRDIPKKKVFVADNNFLKQLSVSDREMFCEYAVIANKRTYNQYNVDIVPGLNTADNDFIARLSKHYQFCFDVDKEIAKLNYKKPVVFITGRQDTCVGYHDLWNLMESYPRATFSTLDLAGHNLQIEQAKLFNCLMANWIDRTKNNLDNAANYEL